jgi:hypothetical protein
MLKPIESFFRQLKPFDRRKDNRFTLHSYLPCVCVYTQADQRQEIQSHIKNIAKGGLLITTGEAMVHPGKEVEIRFQLPNQEEMRSIHGKVLRSYRKDYSSWHYSAIQFHNREEKDIKLLLDFASKES